MWGGDGNELGMMQMAGTLCLDGLSENPDNLCLEAWRKIGISQKDIRTLAKSHKAQMEVAARWLALFDWNIVSAEAAIGKKKCRNRAKLCVFTKLFGGGATALALWTGTTKDKAAAFLNLFDTNFPTIAQYSREVTRAAKRDGCIWTVYGERIAVDPNFAYKGVNYGIQGSAAGLLKRALIACHDYLRSIDVDIHLVLPVHDEIIFEANKKEVTPDILKSIKMLCEDPEGWYDLPIVAKIERADMRWSRKVKIDDCKLCDAEMTPVIECRTCKRKACRKHDVVNELCPLCQEKAGTKLDGSS